MIDRLTSGFDQTDRAETLIWPARRIESSLAGRLQIEVRSRGDVSGLRSHIRHIDGGAQKFAPDRNVPLLSTFIVEVRIHHADVLHSLDSRGSGERIGKLHSRLVTNNRKTLIGLPGPAVAISEGQQAWEHLGIP